MTTHAIYELLLQGVDDALERRVLQALLRQAGRRVCRSDLVFEVQGINVPPGGLATCGADRQNREAIKRLQARGVPVLASSGQAGYMLGGDERALDEYLAELSSRSARLQEKIRHLRAARKWLPLIRLWIAGRETWQERLL